MHTTEKKYREWEELFRSLGCIVTGATNNVEIHHVKGRKFKHNKELIGPIFIIPLHEDLHMITGKHPNAYHKNKKGFIREFGDPRDMFQRCLVMLEDVDWPISITEEEMQAIREVWV